VRRLKRYIEGKHKETGADITVLHVAIRALGVALRQIPEVTRRGW
jgi:pyruvate/2-oxoglutarate dehydrogenase complex dihydrolipoamide acyltransferase (E2) component